MEHRRPVEAGMLQSLKILRDPFLGDIRAHPHPEHTRLCAFRRIPEDHSRVNVLGYREERGYRKKQERGSLIVPMQSPFAVQFNCSSQVSATIARSCSETFSGSVQTCRHYMLIPSTKSQVLFPAALCQGGQTPKFSARIFGNLQSTADFRNATLRISGFSISVGATSSVETSSKSTPSLEVERWSFFGRNIHDSALSQSRGSRADCQNESSFRCLSILISD